MKNDNLPFPLAFAIVVGGALLMFGAKHYLDLEPNTPAEMATSTHSDR